MAEKPGIVNPNDLVVGAGDAGGLQFAVIADLPEGGWVQITPGLNPLAQPMPGPRLDPGCLLVVIPPDSARHIRAMYRQARAAQMGVNNPDHRKPE